MKRVTLLFLAMVFAAFMVNGQDYELTFQVDMAEQGAIPAGVSAAGNFQVAAGYDSDWTPGITMLSQVGTTTVWDLTVTLPAGYYQFKYVMGDSWENVPGGCADGGNRFIDLTGNTVLDLVCFGSCTICAPPEVEVTFQVNMADQTVSDDGVHIAGSLQGWDPAATEMTLDHDAVYTYTASLPIGDFVEYKFVNGNAWGQDESVPGCCNMNGNRYFTVPDVNTVLDVVCFGSCSDCSAEVVDITFQVDMTGQEINVADGVHLVGNFPGMEWDPAAILMDDMGNNIFAATQSLPLGFCLEYKFVNGDEWGEDESVPAECAMGFNRYMLVPDANQILDPVCFGSCEGCEGGTSDLFFSEYAEGSSSNKYVEIYNGTGEAVDLSEYQTHRISNGGDWDENIYPLAGILPDGDVWVIANEDADDYIKDRADEFSSLTWFNGDDAVGLSKIVDDGYVIIDKIGDEGPDPGSGWDVAGVSNATKNHTLVRKDNVCGPNDDWPSSAGTDVNDSEWIVYPQNDWDYLGFHVANCGGAPVVATPAFSENPGLVTASFDLTITCDTPDAAIFYTTDGSDPDFTSTEYTVAINISVTTTVKAIAYAAGYGSSSIGSALYQFPVEVADLAALRAAAASDAIFYELTGEVILTFQQGYRNQKYVQDATAAILIDDYNGIITTTYVINDGITGLLGTLTTYGNMLQFVPVFDPGAATSSGNVIVPEVITINDMLTNFEEYESELVEILAVDFTGQGGSFETGEVYDISDGSKADGFFRTTFYDVDYIGSGIAPYFNSLIGICNSRYDGEYITSRSLEDFDIPATLIVVSPNGGEQIEQGTEFEITWDYFAFEGTVSIALSTDDTKYYEILVEDVPVADKSYVWNVTQTYADNYLIDIMGATDLLFDQSDNVFSVIPPIDIVITEIMYNPPESGSDTLEFIEFYNNGEGVVNLLDWEFTQGVGFTFPDHIFNPGEYVIVCESASAFLNTFGLEVYEWESGSLSNGGEDIILEDNAGIERCYVDYDDGGDWYPVTDGEGPSLTFCDPDMDNNDPAYWSASTKLAAINADGEGIYCTPLMSCNTDLVLPIWYPSGWTGISSNLMLSGKMPLEELFAPALGNFIIMVGETGIFWPGQNVNTIGDWDTYEGYKVKLDGSTYFVYPGDELVDRSVTLGPGTHYLPVLSEGPASVEEVIVPLGDSIEFMYDIVNTLVYWPAGGIVPGVESALETLYPGYGYLVMVNETVTIDFGSALPKGFSPMSFTASQNTTTWNDVVNTGGQHLISVMATENLETGDVIGVFNSQGTCTGMASFAGDESVLSLVVFNDDQTTGELDGMLGAEFMSMKIFRNGETIDVTAVYDMSFENHDGLFAQNGLSVIRELKMGATGIGGQAPAYSIYPNPGNGQFNIVVEGEYNVTVTNAHGQEVMTTRIKGNDMLDLSNQPNGIYFIHLTNQTSTLIEKVIIR